MKRRILWISIFLLVGLVIILFITSPKVEKWTYDLPNDYSIKKTSDTSVVLGKYINDSFEVEYDNKQIGIEEYVAEFRYSDNYISLKCLEPVNNNVKVKFYIIDSKNENIYGPYDTEEIYNEVAKKIVDEELGNWIETITVPKGATNK